MTSSRQWVRGVQVTIDEARQVIDAACQEWIRKGGRIVPGAFRIKKGKRTCACQLLSKRQRAATPIPFRDLLLSIARSACEAAA